jgi:hypothetical protein
VFELTGSLQFEGDLKNGVASIMSPGVTRLHDILSFKSLEQHLKILPKAKRYTPRDYALIYCEAGVLLSRLGILPFKKDIANVPLPDLRESLADVGGRSIVRIRKSAVADGLQLTHEQLCAEHCLRLTEGAAVQKLFPTKPLRGPKWWHDHYAMGAESIAPLLMQMLRRYGYKGSLTSA